MNDQLIADLKETRRQLEVHGWCQGSLASNAGKLCLDGAIGLAVTGILMDYGELELNPRSRAVCEAISAPVQDGLYEPGVVATSGRGYEDCWTFNDHPGRTVQDVYDVLDKAIAESGGGLA